jgi:hypothetical protein
VYSVWRANAPPIIWHVAPKVIPHFYLALVTVCPPAPTMRLRCH